MLGWYFAIFDHFAILKNFGILDLNIGLILSRRFLANLGRIALTLPLDEVYLESELVILFNYAQCSHFLSLLVIIEYKVDAVVVYYFNEISKTVVVKPQRLLRA